MRYFRLDLLHGSGTSLAENFEELILELARADLVSAEVFRISPPDGGIDIFSRGRPGRSNVAFQCKAYGSFRSDLLASIRDSIIVANKSFNAFPWDIFYLVIPFVPTMEQRIKIQAELAKCRGETRISDADEIEASLFRHKHIANRFFPNILVAAPDGLGGLTLGSPSEDESIRLNLKLREWGQTVPISISKNAAVGSLLSLLTERLSLPYRGQISAHLRFISYALQWQIWQCSDPPRELNLDDSFSSQDVGSSSDIELRFSFHITSDLEMGAYDNFAGRPEMRRPKTILSSYWNEEELAGQESFDFEAEVKRWMQQRLRWPEGR